MGVLRFGLAIICSALLLLWAGSQARAFHDGGVGRCSGCHSMHGTGTGRGSMEGLLQGTDPSSVCLNCHSGLGSPDSYSVASPDGSAMTPGGDFYWLKKSFLWTGGSSEGDRHGHNIVAQDYGFGPDASLLSAPGGTYDSTNLACTSCHDPHGKKEDGSNPAPILGSGSYGDAPGPGAAVGNYRLLGGRGYDGGQQDGAFAFNHGAPVARQSALRKFGESDLSHVDYGSGMSQWCANCHSSFVNSEHRSLQGTFGHPTDQHLEGFMIDNYNRYVKTGDLSGTRDTAYFALVPFERGVTGTALLDPESMAGPDANSTVMCLTCHRAHASAFRAIGRWDFDAPLMVDSHPAAGDVGVTGNDVLYSYYGRNILGEFGASQRAFCEKCHDPSGP
jgi:hypothetical protein